MECLQPTITEMQKSTPLPAAFLCVGEVVGGKFTLSNVYIQTHTLEAQESIQAFLEVHGLINGHID